MKKYEKKFGYSEKIRRFTAESKTSTMPYPVDFNNRKDVPMPKRDDEPKSSTPAFISPPGEDTSEPTNMITDQIDFTTFQETKAMELDEVVRDLDSMKRAIEYLETKRRKIRFELGIPS